jgi:acetoin utilization deacetylase AcuC-like enzyme
MGFCLFNNVALAAEYAVTKLGYKRVLIVDWDVHPGNGTQALHYYNPQVALISLQQHPLWCHTGWFTEDGAGEGKGYNVNVPLPAGTGDQGYLSAWTQIVRPVALEYEPDLILLSAGYDAHKLDPVGGQKVSTTGFARLTAGLLELSRLTGAKVIGFLEGGYNPQALAESVVATLRVLTTDSEQQLAQVTRVLVPYEDTGITGDQSPWLVETYIEAIRRHYAQYWRSLRTQSRAA